MNIKLVRNLLIGFISIIGCLYILFLLLPFILSPIINNYIPQVNEEIKKATGLVSSIEDVKLLTTPKFTVGAKIGKFIIKTPDNKEVLNAENFQAKMSLLPLFAKRIELDLVKLDKVDVFLGLNKDGSFEIEKYLPEQIDTQENNETENPEATITELPFGLRLSNHLPDIKVGPYSIKFTDISNGKYYILKGNKAEITDFIFNKRVKVLADGNFTLDNREQFKYNLKINNKIMPDLDLHELVFNPDEESRKGKKKKNKQDVDINILDILHGLYDYKITANVDSDIVLTNEAYKGYLNIDNMSVSPSGLVLPPSDAKLQFNGDKINVDSNFYTAQNEKSTLNGTIKTGKHTNIDLNFKSDADLANLIKIINAFAMTFNIKDLQTLSANGKLDADFNVKSNLKTVTSDGYLKIPSAIVKYGLYNITIDKINTDIALTNNNIDIKNLSFTIFGQPLKLYGLVKEDASADLHLVANNLSLKGLIVACGQAALLKENQINSGLVSLKADIVGKLESIKPTAKVILSNLNIKNIPSNTVIKLPLVNVNIVADGQTFSGTATGTDIKAINPVATVSVPKLSANIKEDVIEITQTPVKVEKINFNINGKIKNYMTEKIALDFVTTGDIKSKLSGDMNVVKQTLNLLFATTENSSMVIPMFDKSKLIFNSNLNITGSIMNPQVSGSVNVPSLSMPEIPVVMENIYAKLHGDILNGSATVGRFVNNGIIATGISSDFSMKGENFYLKNLSGSAFDGNFNGNIVYNMANAKTSVQLKGEHMNAEKAVEGAAGLKGALTGTLKFDTNLNLIVYPDFNDLMRSITGKLTFNIANGAFGRIGRIENFLQAGNILANTVLKSTVASFANLTAIKNSAKFDYISGDMNLANGWANINNIKSTGKSIAYFVTGKYNLINGTANITILGRMDGAIVKLLGPIGDLSAEKILSIIPKLGELTARYATAMTTDPDKERTKDIPKLSTETEIYKDFKIEFNGGIESVSSVKSFKWLSKVDLSAIESMSIKDTVKSLKSNLNNDVNTTVTTVKDTVNAVKEQKEQLKQSVKELKNLFKLQPIDVPATETETGIGTGAGTETKIETESTVEQGAQ